MLTIIILMALVFLIGGVMGATAMTLLTLISCNGYAAQHDRAELLKVLVAHEIDLSTANKIADEGLNTWAQWRAKMRPALWALALDWQEYGEVTKAEFMRYYERYLPQPEPEPEQSSLLSEVDEDGLPVELPVDLLPTSDMTAEAASST